MDLKSVTLEEFEGKHLTILNTIAELMISHPDIPEEVDQSDLLGSLNMLTTELRNSLSNRVPEFVKLQDELAKKQKQITKLQETNQQLYLKVGSLPDPAQAQGDGVKVEKLLSFPEIGKVIDSI